VSISLLCLFVLSCGSHWTRVSSVEAHIVAVYNNAQQRILTATADFGPQVYNKTLMPMVISEPLIACSNITNTAAMNGSLVFIKRSNPLAGETRCSFIDKAKRAQDAGAAAVIIGDYRDSTSLICMQTSLTYPGITIPVAAITRHHFDEITGAINASSVPILSELTQDIGFCPGELPDYSASLQTVGLLLLLMPALWCILATIYYVKRSCLNRHQQAVRRSAAADIPLVEYQPEFVNIQIDTATTTTTDDSKDNATSTDASGAPEHTSTKKKRKGTSPVIHNESCAICFDDFQVGEKVKLLPCGHAFHGDCIDPWIDDHSDLCPMCKQNFVELAEAQDSGRRCGCC
jgi:E3 ubiquitin-protein ligase RNF13